MKTYITTLMKTLTLASCLILGINQQANAQCNPERRAHLIVDWQMNAPLNTDFADKISGWGMNFEGLYDITPRLSAGAFVSHQSPIRRPADTATFANRKPYDRPATVGLPVAFRSCRQLRTLHTLTSVPLCRRQAGSHVCPQHYLLRHTRPLRQGMGLLCLARSRPENLSYEAEELGIPPGRLLQLCHQPYGHTDRRHRRSEQRRIPPRYHLLTIRPTVLNQ